MHKENTMSKCPNFNIVVDSLLYVVLEDIGPWDKFLTITNGAEKVVAKMYLAGLGERRLFYYDSEGDLTELKHDNWGKFIGFGFGMLPKETA